MDYLIYYKIDSKTNSFQAYHGSYHLPIIYKSVLCFQSFLLPENFN